MLLQDILQISLMSQHDLYIQRPLNLGLTQFSVVQMSARLLEKQPQIPNMNSVSSTAVDNDEEFEFPDPHRGNNWEASSSTNPPGNGTFMKMDLLNQEPDLGVQHTDMALEEGTCMEIDISGEMNNTAQTQLVVQGVSSDVNEEIVQEKLEDATGLELALIPDDENHVPLRTIMSTQSRKRKSRNRSTPIVDDEIQRNTRQHQVPGFVHMELDKKSKPRKLVKEDTTLLIRQLESAMEDAATGVQDLPIQFMQNLATDFCEVPPEDVTSVKLLSNEPHDQNNNA
jgi:hypothetical protein